jgi:hypothetical protein
MILLRQPFILFAPLLLMLTQVPEAGKKVPNVRLTDVYDNEKDMPFLGKKVFLLLYIDPDRQHIIDPLTNALDSQATDQENFEVVSVINCNDTWIPYFALRNGAKKEQKRYPDSPILFDKDRRLPSAWAFGDCDNVSIVAVVGRDSMIKFIQKLKSEDECKSIVPTVLKILEEVSK